ncbi:MAG: arginine--tRNA ligase [Candidatus Aenigmarchaeota archaeon]|nr:arginine--tRNA ligase [Candidatus Aenigmarchaeota archaeon]
MVRKVVFINWENILKNASEKVGLNLAPFVKKNTKGKFGAYTIICFEVAKNIKDKSKLGLPKDANIKDIVPELVKIICNNIDLSKNELLDKVEVIGPYINFQVLQSGYMKQIITNILTSPDFISVAADNKKIVIEHTSVNPGKPWHIGHARNAVLGDTLGRCAKLIGYNIEIQNYIDDLGKQAATVYWGIKNLKNLPDKKGLKEDLWQGMVYAQSAGEEKKDDKSSEKIKQIMKLMEEGDNETASESKEIAKNSILSQGETAARMGIFYNAMVWESDIVKAKLVESAISKLLESGKAFKVSEGEDKGCIVVDMSKAGKEFSESKKPYKIIVRSNGVSTYTGKDIAYQMWKFGLTDAEIKFSQLKKQENGEILFTSDKNGKTNKKFGCADIVINVIGSEQAYPQKVVYSALMSLGFEKQSENSHHLSYESVVLPEGRLSGRSGNWIGSHLDAVLDATAEKVYENMKNKKYKTDVNLTDKEQKEVSEKIGVSSVRYFLINASPSKQITFNLDKILDFEGNSALYLMYTLARAKAILRKLDVEEKDFNCGKIDFSNINNKESLELALALDDLPNVLSITVEYSDPGTIATYTMSLAGKFNNFYQNTQKIKDIKDETARNSMIGLVIAVKKVFEKCFDAMGIATIESM